MHNKNVDPLHTQITSPTIDSVYEFNFLCLTINENLNCKSHIDKIANTISKN